MCVEKYRAKRGLQRQRTWPGECYKQVLGDMNVLIGDTYLKNKVNPHIVNMIAK